jgi:flavodoxin
MKDALEGHDVVMKKVADTTPESLKDYDVVFLGSGIYAGKIKRSLTDLIKKAEELAPKFVFFCTHASPAAYQKGFRIVRKKIEGLNSEIIGEWDCRGENIGIPKEQTKAMLDALPPEQREKAAADQEALKGHPNEEDFENAKKFIQSIIK